MINKKRNGEVLCEKAVALLQYRYSNADLSVSEISEELHITPNYLSTLFKKYTGKTFVEILTERRIEKAKELLRDTNLKVYEIATRCGYSDTHYFSFCFKKETGISPKQYRVEENIKANEKYEKYKEITTYRRNSYDNMVVNIHNDLMDEGTISHFYKYHIFQEIYRYQVLKKRKTGAEGYLLLFTLKTKKDLEKLRDIDILGRIDKGMLFLKKCMEKELLLGDIASQFNENQIIVLMMSANGKEVAEYICRRFRDSINGISVDISYEMEKV